MRKLLRDFPVLSFLLLMISLTLFSAQGVSAAATTLKSGDLKNVTKAPVVSGKWEKTSNGTKFVPQEGTTLTDQWINYKNKIYYLGEKGYRQTGWVKYRSKLYHLTKSGILQFGWCGKRYLRRDTGAAAKGFYAIDGKTYYFNSSRNRVTGWKKIQGSYYYFTDKGVMRKSCWIHTSDHYYRLGKAGKRLRSVWITLKGNKYYINKYGYRVTGSVKIGGKWYYFKANGVYDPSVKANSIDPSKKMVALTFDDGPGPYTERLLDCLRKNNSRATFFMVGSNVSSRASTVKRMATLGCEMGNHSWSHPQLSKLSSSAISSQITRTSAAIKSASGKNPTVCRLPYGDGHNSSYVLNAIGLPSIYWSIDTRDWANTGNPQHTINAVLNNVKSGDIILMHDIHASSVTAAQTIIPTLISRGYQLVTVSELAQYKGKTTLQKGKTYYSFK